MKIYRKTNPRYKKAYHLLNALALINQDKSVFETLWTKGGLRVYFGSSFSRLEAKEIFRRLWVEQMRNMPKAVLERRRKDVKGVS